MGYPMYSVRDIETFINVISKQPAYVAGRLFYSALFFLKSDVVLKDYVYKYLDEIHNVSRDYCVTFMLLENTEIWDEIIDQMYRTLENQTFREVQGTMSFNFPERKITTADVISISEKFGVEASQMPCIVFFNDLNSKNVLRIPLYSFKEKYDEPEEWSDVFRKIYHCTADVIVNTGSNDLSILEKRINRELFNVKFWNRRSLTLEEASHVAQLIQLGVSIGTVLVQIPNPL